MALIITAQNKEAIRPHLDLVYDAIGMRLLVLNGELLDRAMEMLQDQGRRTSSELSGLEAFVLQRSAELNVMRADLAALEAPA